MKPLVPRQKADQDVDDAIAYFAREAPHWVDSFIEELEAAYGRISEAPKTGSPRYATLLAIPGLRAHLVARFPYIIFYLEHPHVVDVVRVLHQHRDIPAILIDE